jgi:methionine-S-sulfoxide reductase
MNVKIVAATALLALVGFGAACNQSHPGDNTVSKTFPAPTPSEPSGDVETATLGSGCFWCTEAVFQQLKGVKTVVSGYSGGSVPNPSYEQVCTGATGHAEVIQVTFDPKVIGFGELLKVFWASHDPTTLNRQGNDFGTQYRSAIFYHTPKQKEQAEDYMKKITDAKVFDAPIVTEIVPFTEFYPAEGYHQDYWNRNPQKSYCRAVIPAKLEKLRKAFADKVK